MAYADTRPKFRTVTCFGRDFTCPRFGEFDVNPSEKPPDDRADLALIKREERTEEEEEEGRPRDLNKPIGLCAHRVCNLGVHRNNQSLASLPSPLYGTPRCRPFFHGKPWKEKTTDNAGGFGRGGEK